MRRTTNPPNQEQVVCLFHERHHGITDLCYAPNGGRMRTSKSFLPFEKQNYILQVIVSLGLLSLCGCNLVSDAKLRQRFDQQKEGFSTLVKMANEDRRVSGIGFDSTTLDNDDSWPRKDIGFSVQRWEQYRSLFREL